MHNLKKTNLKFWSSELEKWNFGDALTVLLYEEIFYDIPTSASEVRIIGSTLSDGFVPRHSIDEGSIKWRDGHETKAIFWGCGLREDNSLSGSSQSVIDILAVRGPRSASSLRLGADVAIGEPGLLTPIFYSPINNRQFLDKTVCVPHYNDKNSDHVLSEQTQCDLVLRPNIEKNINAVKGFIDSIVSAEFVLCGSLHAAVIALAYGKPFAFWDTGEIDLPFKWKDFADLVGIPTIFVKDIAEARIIYREKIVKKILFPSLWKLLIRSPFLIRPDALLKVFYYELSKIMKKKVPIEAITLIHEIQKDRSHFKKMELMIQKEIEKKKDIEKEHTAELKRSIELQNMIKTLNIEISHKNNEIDEKHRKIARQNDYYRELKECIEDKARIIHEYEQTIENMRIYLENVLRREAARESDVEKLDQKIFKLVRDLEGEKLKNNELIQKIETVSWALANATDEKEKHKESLLEAHEKISEYERTIDSERVSNLRLMEENKAIEQDLEQLKIKFDEININCRKIAQEKIENEDHINVLEKQLSRTLNELNIQQEKNSSLEKNNLKPASIVDQLENIEKTIDHENIKIKKSKEEILRKLVDQKTKLEQVKIQKANLEREYEILKIKENNKYEEHIRILSEKENLIKTQQSEIKYLNDELFKANDKVSCVTSELARNKWFVEEEIEKILSQIEKNKKKSIIFRFFTLNTSSQFERIAENYRIIDNFLNSYDISLVGEDLSGRSRRIISYVLGITDGIADFPFFSDCQYSVMYPDISRQVIIPLVHYIKYGLAERRNAHPLLDTEFYFTHYPDAEKISQCPAIHFLKYGASKCYNPHLLFNTSSYLNRYPDVRESGINPLQHYLKYDRCTIHELFDPNYYISNYGGEITKEFNPVSHFLLIGWKKGYNPSAKFELNYYLSKYSDVKEASVNPLLHYVKFGAREGREIVPDLTVVDQHVSNNGNLPIVVMADALLPRPDQDSGSMDQLSFIKIFQKLGFEVHYFAAIEALLEKGDTEKYSKMLSNIGVKIVTETNGDTFERFLFEYSEKIKVLFLSRIDFGSKYLGIAKYFCPNATVLFNTVDLHYIRELRKGQLLQDPMIVEEAMKIRERELDAVKSADVTIVVSDYEEKLLKEELPGSKIYKIPLIREYSSLLSPVPFEARSGIGFIGSFLHQPNLDAIDNFLENIWPIVLSLNSQIHLRVIGSNIPERLTNSQVKNVEFVGYVEDLEAELDKLRLTIAPLRYGAGAKGKLVSSLGRGVPAVVSAIAAEGMGLNDRKEILLAELDHTFAEAIIELYGNRELWTSLSVSGSELIKNTYSLENGIKILENILSEIRA